MQDVIHGLQCLRGVAEISAVTVVAELGQISRFDGARQLMGYSEAVPSEESSGKRQQRGGITKTGNAHLRRIVVEAAWSYRLRPAVGPGLRKRQQGVPEDIKEMAWKAQLRLHKRYATLAAAGKDQRKIVIAVGRELLGFIWAIGVRTEAVSSRPMAACIKAKAFLSRKNKTSQRNEQRSPTRDQNQPQPEHARRRILAGSMRQAQPDSRL